MQAQAVPASAAVPASLAQPIKEILHRADIAFGKSQLRASREMYEKILQLDRGNVTARIGLAKIALKNSKFSTACTVMIADDDDDDASGSEFGHARGNVEALEVLGDALAGSKTILARCGL